MDHPNCNAPGVPAQTPHADTEPSGAAARPRIAALALPATVGTPQILLPSGTFDAPRGAMLGQGPWHLSDERGARIAAALSRRAARIVIDYEHQTLRSAHNGKPAPASGWIDPPRVSYQPGAGIVAAAVHWTDRASGYIRGDEYGYLSPVFSYDAQGNVVDLLHVALTNTPALDSLPEVALAAASRLSLYPLEIAAMSDLSGELRERVLYLLNLPLTSTDAEIAAALDSLKTMITSGGGGGTAAASLPALIADQAERIAALTAQTLAAPPPDVVADLQRQVAALTAAAEGRERAALLAACVADGRLLGGSKLHAHAAALPLAALAALAESLTPIPALTAIQTGGVAPAGVETAAAGAADPTPFTAALAAEFGDEATYRAYQRAVHDGRVKILGGTTQ